MQCTHNFNISLNQCVKDYTNPGMAYLITVNPCLDALTNPADIPSGSISIVWNGASSTCDDSLGADVITYGVPSPRTRRLVQRPPVLRPYLLDVPS